MNGGFSEDKCMTAFSRRKKRFIPEGGETEKSFRNSGREHYICTVSYTLPVSIVRRHQGALTNFTSFRWWATGCKISGSFRCLATRVKFFPRLIFSCIKRFIDCRSRYLYCYKRTPDFLQYFLIKITLSLIKVLILNNWMARLVPD